MHGSIHSELRGYIIDRHSEDAYEEILRRAELAGKEYEATGYYADEEIHAILAAAEPVLRMSREDILYEYGVWVAPGLLAATEALLDPSWRTLDLVEATEPRIHLYMRDNAGAKPPVLQARRLGADHLVIDYWSHRKMCALGEGFIEGIANHYGERVNIDQPTCMHRGDAKCTIEVKVVGTVGLGDIDAGSTVGTESAN